ncbi:MAG: T9SS type A sorting domain-containing protein [Bacteroidales bacterium]|nr:T9SS type A sorting domain-containing protein [Bacteroidales bacterium]
MKKIIFLFLSLLAITGKPQNCVAEKLAVSDTALTFILSNEAPGFLIDNLIANGYGDSCLYSVLVALQPISGGVITDAFLDSLASCPAGSEIFTAELYNFSSEYNNPIGIGEDGHLIVAQIYGRDYLENEGFITYNDTLVPVGLKLFTKAIGPEYYIDAGSHTIGGVTTIYKAFAIAWSLGSTVVLTNEAPGYLIDKLIANGFGSNNLFEVLTALQPVSGGTIPLDYLNQLAACPAGSEIFTVPLINFAGLNNPVCMNSNGTLSINPIFGRDYYQDEGYGNYIGNYAGVGNVLFTYAISPQYYIYASVCQLPNVAYKAFVFSWSDPSVDIPEAETIHQSFSVYPNPFSEGFYIPHFSEKTQIEIYDIHEKLIYHTELKANNWVQPDFLSKGVYILKLKNDKGSWQKKIIKY